MLLLLLGLFDVLVGFALLSPIFSAIAFYLGVIALLKGLISLVSSFACGYYADFMGAIDFLAGLMLLLGFSLPLFWVLLLVKGFWSMMFGFFQK